MSLLPSFVNQDMVSITHNPFFIKYGLIGLFANGLFSSVIPIPTEITASALLLAGEPKLNIFLVLLASSIIGGVLAYYIGKSGTKLFKFLHKKPNQAQEQKTHKLFDKYGWLLIFICPWIPVIGDFIPIVAGSKNYDFRKFIISMASGKAVKLVIIVYLLAFFAPKLFGTN